MQYDQESELGVAVALNGATIATDTTTNGVAFDTKGFEAITFVYRLGARTDGTFTPLIEDSDDNITFAAVDDAYLTVTEASCALNTANTVSKIGYVGKKRYVRPSVVSASTTSGAHVSAIAIKGKNREMPV